MPGKPRFQGQVDQHGISHKACLPSCCVPACRASGLRDEVLHLVVQVGHWDEAVSRFQAMLAPSSPVRPTASTFNTIMSGYMKHGEYGKVSGQASGHAGIASKLMSAWELHLVRTNCSANWLAAQDVWD